MQFFALDYQLTPPYMHPTNASKKATDNWKCHFISKLDSVDPSFQLHFWCRLIFQVTTTLILLWPSCINLRLSAESQRKAPTTSFTLRSLHLACTCSSVKPRPSATPWPVTALAAGTLATIPNTITSTASTPRPQPLNTSPKLSIFPHNCAMPKRPPPTTPNMLPAT